MLTTQIGSRVLFWLTLLSLGCFSAGRCCADTAIPREKLPLAWQADAELTDVFFRGPQMGWAVGAQGVILRTTDGGETWLEHGHVSTQSIADVPLNQKLKNMRAGTQSRWTGVTGSQTSLERVRCRFESVYFADANHGWVAGGYNVPWMNRSRAVIMRTNDGGVTWQRIDELVIPRIRKIRFSSPANGWALGETSNLFQTGIYYTSDGGRSWSSPANVRMNHWLDGRQSAVGFVVIDQHGKLAVVKTNKLQSAGTLDCPRDYRVSCLQMLDSRNGWAAGERGLILKTLDGGMSWRRFRPDDSTADWASINFTCMAKTKDQIVLATEFGSTLYRIDAKDQSVTTSQLPTNLPLRKICFSDSQHGYAIGELGTILATADGGKTWGKQRGQHERLALLTITQTARDTPLELLSINAGEESRICGTIVVAAKPDLKSVGIQSAERVGSSLNWQWSLGDDTDETIDRLVQAIRTVRPLVVVCNGIPTDHADDRQSSLEQQVTSAIIQAARGEAKSGLQPWQVERLAVNDPAGAVRFDPQRMLPSMGVQVEDQIALSRALLGLSIGVTRHSAWRVAHPGTRRSMTGKDLLSGVGRSRRVPVRQGKTSLGNLNRLNQALSKQKQLEQFGKFVVNTDRDLLVWQQKLLPFVLTMDEDVSGLWLIELAENYVRDGRFDMAAQTLQVLSTRWPNHAFSPAALAWLSTWYSSDEMSQIDSLRADVSGNGAAKHHVALASHEADVDGSAIEASAKQVSLFAQRNQAAAGSLGRLGQADPDLMLEPGYQWLESRILAKLSGAAAGENKLQQLAESTRNLQNGFARAARWGLDTIHGRTARPGDAPALHCVWANEPPRLDGRLTDAVWQSALENGKMFEQSPWSVADNPDEMPRPDRVVFARDDRFLYAAFQCQKLPSQYYGFKKKARPRDPDLSRRDRIEFQIDTDRDFCTSLTFAVDHRGWVSESANGGVGWDPDWYVAQAEDGQSWTVEIAIPLELFCAQGSAALDRTQPWAVCVDRLGGRSDYLWRTRDQALPVRSVGLQAGLVPQPQAYELMDFEIGDSPAR